MGCVLMRAAACYESKTKLLVSSEVPVTQIFSGTDSETDVPDHMRVIMDDLVRPSFLPPG